MTRLITAFLLIASAANIFDSVNAQYHTYSAICAVGRDENRYVREWAEYHLCLGIGTIHLFDHGSNVSMDSELADLISKGQLSYQRFEGNHKRYAEGFSSQLDRFSKTAQGYAYKECLAKYSTMHTFIGFIDIDEFMVINDEKAASIDEVLRDYEPYGGVSFHWRVLGSSGHESRPAAPVVSAYTKCMSTRHEVNRQIKSFVNTRFQPIMHSPHRAAFPELASAPVADDAGDTGGGGAADSGSNSAKKGGAFLVDENYQPLKRGMRNKASWDRVAIYHYVTKSREDFRAKVERGGGAGVTRNMDHFDKVDSQAYDTCNGAIETRQRFCGSLGR